MAMQPISIERYTKQLAEMAGFLNRACSFTGHRPHKLPWRYNENAPGCVALKQILTEQILSLVDEGYTDFLSGMALGVDIWAAQIVLDLKKKEGGLGILGLGGKPNAPKLHCILPCEGQESKWPASSQKQYHAILEKADSIVYVNREYSDKCMLERNHVLIDFSSVLLAVYNGEPRCGTAATVRYARKQGRAIILVDPVTLAVTSENNAPGQAQP